MSAQKSGFGPRRKSRPSLATASSLSLRWRVMLLAMSMVAMVVVLMAVAVYAVVSRALYDDIDNQLHSRARLLIESGSLAADPGKAIEGTPAGPSIRPTRRARRCRSASRKSRWCRANC
jgi:two-component system sensor histidine kinase MprB